MRVALVAGTFVPEKCGVADYTAHLRSALEGRGIQTVVFTSRGVPARDSIVGAVRHWGPSEMPKLARAIARCGADLVHVQYAPGTYRFKRGVALLPAFLRLAGWRGPIVTTLHEYGGWSWEPCEVPKAAWAALAGFGQSRGWWDEETGFLVTASEAVIVSNQIAALLILERLPDRAGRLHGVPLVSNVTPATVSRDAGEEKIRRATGWPPDSVVLAFFGFVHPVKGLETLFQAMTALDPRVRLLVIGASESLALPAAEAREYRTALHRLSTSLHLAGRVHFTGRVADEEVSRLLAGADLGVLPFNHGCTLKSGSLLAMLAHGLPVVTTIHSPPDTGLTSRLVELVPPKDPAALANAIAGLLAHPERRHSLSNAGREFSCNRSWVALARQHEDIYRQILSGRRTEKNNGNHSPDVVAVAGGEEDPALSSRTWTHVVKHR